MTTRLSRLYVRAERLRAVQRGLEEREARAELELERIRARLDMAYLRYTRTLTAICDAKDAR